MPDAADPSQGEQSGEGTGKKLPERVLLVMIVPNRTVLDDIVTGLLDMGVGGTIVESKGLMALVKEEMPVFSGLAALIGEQTGSRVVFSITTEKLAQEVFGFLESEVSEPDRPIAVTVPVSGVLGLRS
jgi:hypothetical protein